jgi:hypothetical protein
MTNSDPQPPVDGSNKGLDGTRADAAFHVPGMS